MAQIAKQLEFRSNFDDRFNFREYMSQVCRTYYYYNIRDLLCIRRYLPLSIAKTIATALVASRLDYCDSLFHNIAIKDITKLQRVQNCSTFHSF